MTPHAPIFEWFCGAYRSHIASSWERLNEPDQKRHLRDAVAHEVLRQRLPSVDDLTYEDILRLREKQADNLIRFRSEIAHLTSEVTADPMSSDLLAHVREFLENRIDPAVVELRDQLKDLRRNSWLKGAVGAPPSAMAVMGLSFFCGMSLAAQVALTSAAAALAAAGVAGDHFRQRAQVRSHPFAILINTR